ncbi:hypothetical protein [Mesorhizobium sp. M1E.F.Ca.ET.063.01.1.1]|nr:hypothetical protein [Mesorhizobium sp. M1E.F.Ca.ET.063.01.1.1]
MDDMLKNGRLENVTSYRSDVVLCKPAFDAAPDSSEQPPSPAGGGTALNEAFAASASCHAGCLSMPARRRSPLRQRASRDAAPL